MPDANTDMGCLAAFQLALLASSALRVEDAAFYASCVASPSTCVSMCAHAPLSRTAARVLRARADVTRLSSRRPRGAPAVRSNSNSPGTPLTGPIPSELGIFSALTQLCGPPARGARGAGARRGPSSG